ncbi:Inner membrane protein YqaA [Ascidiaceihabitans donghaensis]|uniref:Inner membrane protein YqaA n=1 Tax=Ascidiaceihabitans donghaensis TaxID=1510460 RepID=A0A2R8BE46_9RHOB|nr:YqaA family protein [Ascidiaceihabitans donghaensis]SPH21345.1 Inner membrane protein YqaA [Ascidiaceihabitans donghaensis]
MIAYFTLFASALIAATILPLQSEAVLVALMLDGTRPVAVLLMVATVGNVLGAVVNWGLGRFLVRFKDRRWFPASQARLQQAERWYRRYGLWSLLASWVPIIGDPITVIAGVLRAPFWPFLALVTLAKAGRYLVLAAVTLAWLG